MNQNPIQPASKAFSLTSTVLGMTLDPGGLLKERLEHTGTLTALTISGLAFMLFFIQATIDLAHHEAFNPGILLASAMIGFLYGTAGIALIGLSGRAGARLLGADTMSRSEAISAFGLAFSPTLIYTAIGLPFNLFLGWNTAVAFGVTGTLWALGPMVSVLRMMVKGRLIASTILVTGCGMMLLSGWSVLISMMGAFS